MHQHLDHIAPASTETACPLPSWWLSRRTPARLRPDYPECLGPMPVEALLCLIDLGMTDRDIAGYFRLPLPTVTRLTLGLRAGLTA